MTKKIRENLLILLISNIITIILFVTALHILSGWSQALMQQKIIT